MVWQAGQAADPGPKARNCLTGLQQHLVEDFTSIPGRAKIIGVHAPPIGPYPDWYDDDLLRGRKTYDSAAEARGPLNYGTKKPDGTIEKWNGHPLFAIRRNDDEFGTEADYGSFNDGTRRWFIKKVAESSSGVRVVLSGHIHRQGLYVTHVPGKEAGPIVAGQMLIRGVVEPAVHSASPPAVTVTPEGKRGPLYVNTTSAGPRGHLHLTKGRSYSADPGYAYLELSNDGTIGSVESRWLSQPANVVVHHREAELRAG
jgi:hypothetical protein